MVLKERLIFFSESCTNYCYDYFFKQKPGEKSVDFISKLKLIYSSTFIVGVLSLLGFFLNTNFLSPSEYGKFLLLSSAGAILSIPMVLGIPIAVTVYMAKPEAKEDIFSSALLISTVLMIIFSFFYYLLFNYISSWFNFEGTLFKYVLVISVLLTYNNIFDGGIKGAYKINFLAKSKLLSSLLIFLTALSLYLYGITNFQTPFISMFVGFLSFIALGTIRLRKCILTMPSKESTILLLKYALPASIPPIAGVLIWNVDKLFINSFLSTREVGIYGAYSSVSTSFADRAINPFISVLLPVSVKEIKNATLGEKLSNLVKKGWLFIFIAFFIFIQITMFFIKKEYHLDYKYGLLFAVAALVTVLFSIYWWFVAAHDLKGINYMATHSGVATIINILLNFLLIKYFGIIGAVLSYTMTHFYIFIMARKFVLNTVKAPLSQ